MERSVPYPLEAFPKPPEGIWDEVFTEAKVDTFEFVRKVALRIPRENPALMSFFHGVIDDALHRDKGDAGLTVAFYYELWARSAQKNKASMLEIEDTTAQETGIGALEQTKVARRTEEGLIQWERDKDGGRLERRTKEAKFSDEFRKFWEAVDKIEEMMWQAGIEGDAIEEFLLPVSTLQLCLHNQAEINVIRSL